MVVRSTGGGGSPGAVLGREIEGMEVSERCAQAPSSFGMGRSEGNVRSGDISYAGR